MSDEALSSYRSVLEVRNERFESRLGKAFGTQHAERPHGNAASGHDSRGAICLRLERFEHLCENIGGDSASLEIVRDQKIARPPIDKLSCPSGRESCVVDESRAVEHRKRAAAVGSGDTPLRQPLLELRSCVIATSE